MKTALRAVLSCVISVGIINACVFGWVIVDDKLRGKGYGKEMLKLGLHYAFDILKVDQVTLGVFDNNPGAEKCYRAIGFKDNPEIENSIKNINGENWTVKELVISKDEWRENDSKKSN